MNEVCEPVSPSISRIGLVAYCALPPHTVFVRIPNEPGRWVLTHRCVVEVECPHCHAIEGEPCHNGKSSVAKFRKYGTGTHYTRRHAYRIVSRQVDPHKPHLSMNDVRDAEIEPV